jgi:putative ABC transport system permease protein
MLKNYLITAFRNLKRHKVFTSINIVGLAIGFAVSLVITFYLIHGLTFDRFHDNAENIYRVLSIGKKRGTKNSITAGPLMVAIKENIPEIRGATRVTGAGRLTINRPGIDAANAANNEESSLSVQADAILADPGFFDVFDFKILTGAKGDALNTAGNVFLTPKVAKALFGEENPVGKPLSIRGIENPQVAGIVETPPSNSHIQFGVILPLIPEQNPTWWNSWKNLALQGYVSLNPNADPAAVNKKMCQVAEDNNFVEIFEPRLQPLLDVHLGSTDHFYDYFNQGKNDMVVVYIMLAIGVLIVLIACINFINLTTSRASKRAVEVGIRKVIGANRLSLTVQFLGESVLMTVTSFLIALTIVQTTLPHLDVILKKKLEVNFSQNPLLILLLFITAVIIGILSGMFPALVLSSFKPANILKGKFQTGKTGVTLRKILVVFQFVMTISLILGVLIVIAQINFLQSRDMGYNREQVLVIPAGARGDADILKDKLENIPGVISLGRIDALPGPDFLRQEVVPEDGDRTKSYTASIFQIDEGLFKTLDISIVKGRNFSRQFATDAENAVIVNETQVRKAGWDINHLTSKRISLVDDEGKIIYKPVIGVIKDFHFLTARQVIAPMVFFFNPQQAPLLMVRLTPGQISQSIQQIEEEYKKLYPDRQMRRFFLDESFDGQFNDDRVFARNIGIFAAIAIFIACLGLIGLVSYTIEQRRLEIVVRKVYGCGELKIVGLLSTDLLKWVVLANVFAWPCGYFAMRMWLNEFVYRVPLTVWPFLIAAVGSLLIAMLTLSFQGFKAARTNPADTLREVG